ETPGDAHVVVAQVLGPHRVAAGAHHLGHVDRQVLAAAQGDASVHSLGRDARLETRARVVVVDGARQHDATSTSRLITTSPTSNSCASARSRCSTSTSGAGAGISAATIASADR